MNSFFSKYYKYTVTFLHSSFSRTKPHCTFCTIFTFRTLATAGIGGVFLTHYLHKYDIVPYVKAARKIDPDFKPPSLRDKFNFVADVLDNVEQSVVHIELVQPLAFNSRHIQSNGSGFIVQDNGLILTNAHVVAGRFGGQIIVTLPDGSKHQGVIEDLDTESDMAIIKCNFKEKYPPIKLGKSSDIRNGEFVIAMGSPLTLNNTNTFGIISNKQRSSDSLGLRKQMNYIQTDAAITFGNSGGPLVNLDGEVIGINSMKVAAGISFAIPIDYAIEFLKSYEKKDKGEKKVKERKFIGITMLTLNEKIIEQLRRDRPISYDVKHGVLIWKVIRNSPADFAGLQPEDIIIELNGKSCTSSKSIYAALELSDNQPLQMVIIRHNVRYTVSVKPQPYSH